MSKDWIADESAEESTDETATDGGEESSSPVVRRRGGKGKLVLIAAVAAGLGLAVKSGKLDRFWPGPQRAAAIVATPSAPTSGVITITRVDKPAHAATPPTTAPVVITNPVTPVAHAVSIAPVAAPATTQPAPHPIPVPAPVAVAPLPPRPTPIAQPAAPTAPTGTARRGGRSDFFALVGFDFGQDVRHVRFSRSRPRSNVSAARAPRRCRVILRRSRHLP